MTAAIADTPYVSAAQFLTALFRDVDDGWVHLFALDRTDGTRRTAWRTVAQVGDLALDAGNYSARSCVWFGPAVRSANLGSRRGGSADCTQITAVWVDIDVAGPTHTAANLPPSKDAARRLVADFPLEPTAVVDTGGGLQAWWFLAEPLDHDEATGFLARWGATWAELGAQRTWHVDNVFDLARIMRLPGTFNHKADPVLVTVDAWAPERRWGVDELDQWCIDPPTPPAPAAGTGAPERTVPYIGPERPGDAFNAAIGDQAPLWEAAGFTLDRTDPAGDRHYRAPHHAVDRGSTGLTIYADDGHATLWSETFASGAGMRTQRPYDAFGAYAWLQHRGDWKAASDQLARIGYGTKAVAVRDVLQTITPPAVGGETDVESIFIDWAKLWARESTEADWLIEPLVARSRGTCIFAPGGTGKSLVALNICAAVATGRFGLSGETLEPIDVLYVDYEMTEDDLRERMESAGYGGDSNLDRLHYALLPSIPPLDTEAGGQRLTALAVGCGAQLVVIDTFSRAVQGDENEADTVRAFYRHTGLALKQRGIAFIRIDHAGKDLAKGQRGTSAKNDDVDVVWQMVRADGGFKMTAIKRRMGWVPETVHLLQHEVPVLCYRVVAQTNPAGTEEVVAELDAMDFPISVGYRKAGVALRDAGKGARADLVRAAQKVRKDRGYARAEAIRAARDAEVAAAAADDVDLGTF